MALAALVFWGCQSNGPPFAPAGLQNPDNASVYVYWPGQRYREKSGDYPEVQLNGVPVGILRYKTYIHIEVAPGTHELRVTGSSSRADWGEPDLSFETPLSRGETKYVRLLVKYDQKTNSLSEGRLGHVVQFLPRAASQARTEMSGLKAAKS